MCTNLFAYAVVIMPGINKLDDRQFIKTFQVTDQIIQNNSPLFMLLWVGSILMLLISIGTGFNQLEGIEKMMLISAGIAYLVGVQLTTIVIHLPLNNQLQKVQLDDMNNDQCLKVRREFEEPWNRSNRRRTAVACGVSFLLVLLAITL